MESGPNLPTAHGSSQGRFTLSSLSGWMPHHLLSSLFTPAPAVPSTPSSPFSGATAGFLRVDVDGSPTTVSPSTPGSPPAVPAASFPPPAPHAREEWPVSRQPNPHYTATTSLRFAKGGADVKPLRLVSGVSANSSIAGESSNVSTPRLAASSATATPLVLSPSMAPFNDDIYLGTPWGLRSGNSPVPAPLTLAQPLAPAPTCVELPGPQSLFVRGPAASGCDKASIGLLQRSVLAPQHSTSSVSFS